MGTSKSEKFNANDNQLAEFAKALAHPARIAIIKILVKQNSCVCGTLVDQLPLSQSTVSQHLKELKEVGIIKGNIEGTKICYCIDKIQWDYARKQFSVFFESVEESNNCCN